MHERKESYVDDFHAIRLTLASPDEIHRWSYGEVLKPETINYRTQKPEKDGLFCERIFGPSKDWECYCGKYKRIRYKGIICDKCGVEVTRSIVRRERMGHVDLAVPVSHIWFLRGIPSKIGLVLDLSVQSLEKVIYFASFIVTKVDENLRTQTLAEIDNEYKSKKKVIEAEFNRRMSEIKKNEAGLLKDVKKGSEKKIHDQIEQEIINNAVHKDEQLKELLEAVEMARDELNSLKPLQIISEQKYQDLSLKYGHVFEAGIGAETIRKLLEAINIDKSIEQISAEVDEGNRSKNRRLLRRLKLLRNLKKNDIRPEWTVLTTVPVIPPDLRPMVPLDGGRFAASDLNDLYRRVINRNNRLKRLIELNAPEVICRNEKRMLQEAVDALIDNGARHGKTITASTGQKRSLKSLADMLKGKQGRFRQNLLGKRVDYSGRSVIVIGPNLKLNQCGLPKKMALELFKPFVISQLIKQEYVHNVRSASRFIESGRPEVWDILETITKTSHVFLNRAPTLHRLGIQAFQPVLIEGKAIQIHPLVCAAFNADFDGDQMAVHVPLTEEAKKEVASLMLSTHNLLKPATGDPVVSPTQDVVLGSYYMTQIPEQHDDESKLKSFSSIDEVLLAYGNRYVSIQKPVRIRMDGKMVVTSAGRVIFNQILPKELGFVNNVMNKKNLRNIITTILETFGGDRTVEVLDAIKDMAFKFVTKSGISWGMDDTPTPSQKPQIIKEAEKEVEEIVEQYEMGLLTDAERRMKVIDIWTRIKERITEASIKTLDRSGSVFAISDSGARGSWAQITQMMGMKGLVNNPSGEIIELPVKGSFTEGFDVLEYFISTHGARKGLSDTALRTANAGYLTRRLVDVSQDVVILADDCRTKKGLTINEDESTTLGTSLEDRIRGRFLAEDVTDKKTKKVIASRNNVIDRAIAEKIAKHSVGQIKIRSVLTCQTRTGACQKCYGWDLGHNETAKFGTAVGIIAAQSIGEPGTQLTMRTFHTGGVAGSDITQGLPRVEELFEVRPIKQPALLSEVDGKVKSIKVEDKQILIVVTAKTRSDKEQDVEYQTIPGQVLMVKKGDLVIKGQSLTEGSIDLAQLFLLQGREAVQRYILKEIQYIYSSQGQAVHDKHVEVIIRQMFSRYMVEDSGDTDLLSGDIVTEAQIGEANDELKAAGKGGKPAKADNLLLGITKVSLLTDSFLSAASFQETARVLIDAAVSGKIDRLRGLKENVIIGKLIPVGSGFRKEGQSAAARASADRKTEKAAREAEAVEAAAKE